MNIFILSTDPIESASYHCDQHINKMIVESAQMLCTALEIRGQLPYEAKRLGFYLPTHHKHPCTQWVAASKTNAWWLYELVEALDKERKILGTPFTHASKFVFDDAFEFYHDPSHISGSLPDSFAEAITPQHIKNDPALDTVGKYRAYYLWKHQNQMRMKWRSPRIAPQWFDSTPIQLELVS